MHKDVPSVILRHVEDAAMLFIIYRRINVDPAHQHKHQVHDYKYPVDIFKYAILFAHLLVPCNRIRLFTQSRYRL
jgi:hypothetical protein